VLTTIEQDTGAPAGGTAIPAIRPVVPAAIASLFTVTAFLSSGLLFAVQPMVARMLLPQLGGSAAAWNTAMVFFQAALLVGYLAAHLSIATLGVRRHTIFQITIAALAALTLPIHLPDGWVPPAGGGAERWTLLALLVMVGAPFVVLSTSAPTLQRWFAATDHPSAGDPYFLYAAGNAGSLIALLAVPLIIDRQLGVTDQARLWTIGFVVLSVLVALCGLVTRQRAPREPIHAVERTSAVSWFVPRWIVWAAIPSALLLAATRHLATDVASIPLLWVVPLALYLATFIAAFGRCQSAALRVGIVGTSVLVDGIRRTRVGTIARPAASAIGYSKTRSNTTGATSEARMPPTTPPTESAT